MKLRCILFFAGMISGFCAGAETNHGPVRLAVFCDDAKLVNVADVLSAKLSQRTDVALLERSEIQKAMSELSLAAANREPLKLGARLNADGVLLLEGLKEGADKWLSARLIAVKPGVVIGTARTRWPVSAPDEWAVIVEGRFETLFPKLEVLARDAIPISVVNLRSATASREGGELERQMTLLLIDRLARQREVFVLERRRMGLLSDEKETEGPEETAFWNGSFLVEGLLDREGYSKDQVTVNASLIPPRGGERIEIALSGKREEPGMVADELVQRILQSLHRNVTATVWQPKEEARKYYDEGKWALKWGMLQQAQTAADASWALGKRDVDCAQLQVDSYLAELSANVGTYYCNIHIMGGGHDVDGKVIGPPPTAEAIKAEIEQTIAEQPRSKGAAYRQDLYESEATVVLSFALPDARPKRANIQRAMHVLELYYNFSRTHPDAALNTRWRASGPEVMTAAAQVLQSFHFVPESQPSVAEELGGLRTLARTVAASLSTTPAARDGYFVGTRLVNHDELVNALGKDNIFSCLVKWGAYWQETPDDCIALYRTLMSSAVFSYIHTDFWLREVQNPRLVAWNENDRRRIPALWNGFMQELETSTNVLWQLEAKALAVADSRNETELGLRVTNLFNAIFDNGAELAANNVEVLYLSWGTGQLMEALNVGGTVSRFRESLNQRFRSDYNPKIEALNRDYWSKTIAARKTADTFTEQKNYLKDNIPFDFMEFVRLFRQRNYTPAQALEIQPLVAAYKSNMLAQAERAPGGQKNRLKASAFHVGALESSIEKILHPPATSIAPPQRPRPSPVIAKQEVPAPPPAEVAETVTNVISVNKFLPIPFASFSRNFSEVVITAHHWQEGKLVLDLKCNANFVTFTSIAILDPVTQQWQVIEGEDIDYSTQNSFYHRTVLFRGEVFTSDGGEVKKYDARKQAWVVLPIPDAGNRQLFSVDGHLYLAEPNSIVEILDGGARTKILASKRRQPPVSVLDTEDLGIPTLFEGPNHSLGVCTKDKIWVWEKGEFRDVCAMPPTSFAPVTGDDGVLFATDGWRLPACVSRLRAGSTNTDLCFGTVQIPPGSNRAGSGAGTRAKRLWKVPDGLSLAALSVGSRGPDMLLLADHSTAENIVNQREHLIIGRKILPKNGYHAALYCFLNGTTEPQKIHLKFEGQNVSLPVTGMDPAARSMAPQSPASWFLFGSNNVFFGVENCAPMLGGKDPRNAEPVIGVWMLDAKEVEAEIARQKMRADVSAGKAAAAFLTAYDQNHNGLIEPSEKEAALDDAAFVNGEVEKIDLNENGIIDLSELIYFDANANKILEPKEQAGLEIALRLLTEKLLKFHDANRDGGLDWSEFNQLKKATEEAPARAAQLFPDKNGDGHIDLSELQAFQMRKLNAALNPPRVAIPAYINPPGKDLDEALGPMPPFKQSVEAYWKKQ